MIYVPSEDYRYAVRFGDRGTDVAVAQLNLPETAVDGVYGVETEQSVLTWQKAHKLTADGICGLETQRSLIVGLSRPASRGHGLPRGLLKSIASNESGFALSAAGEHLGDVGWDVGAFCRSSGRSVPDQAFLRSAYDVTESAEWTASKLVGVREALADPVPSRYLTELAGGRKERFLWQLAILAHNWPVAARNIASKGAATYDDDAPAQWIIDATNGRISTPREWCTDYVRRATVFIRWGNL